MKKLLLGIALLLGTTPQLVAQTRIIENKIVKRAIDTNEPSVIRNQSGTLPEIWCTNCSGGSGGAGDASAANQTAVQANPGADATKAIAVQGVTGGKAIPVTAASLPLPTGAATAANQASMQAQMPALATAGSAAPTTGTMLMGSDGTNARSLSTTATGKLQIEGSNTNPVLIMGAVGAGATDSGNPIKIGGKYNTTLPTLTDGQRGDAQLDTRGNLRVVLSTVDATTAFSAGNSTVGSVSPSGTANKLNVVSYGLVNDGTNYYQTRGDTTGNWQLQVPATTAVGTIVPTASTVAESGRVLKASAGNLIRIGITTAGSAGYLMVFNSTTVPADGTVTPLMCRAIGATSTVVYGMADIPPRFTTGISVAFSTTGCFTKTASATAYIEAQSL